MPPQRPYPQEYDQYANTPVQTQLDNPLTTEFLPMAAANRRLLPAGNGNAYAVADGSVNIRGSKQIIWSSEGWTSVHGLVYPALTTNQKKATGTSALNHTGPTFNSSATLPSGITIPTYIDFSPYRSLLLLINFISITGTSVTFELDYLDDTATPNAYAFKTTALTGAGQIILSIGPDAGDYPINPAPTGFGDIAVVSGTVIYPVPISLAPQGQVAWTVSSVTAAAWNGWLYGIS